MRLPHKKYLLSAAALTLLGAGVAQAATHTFHTMQVAAPDGQIVHVAYSGDVPPNIQFVPAAAEPADRPNPDARYDVSSMLIDPFAHMQQISAMMDAQMDAMMRHAAMVEQQAAEMQHYALASSTRLTSQNAPEGVIMAGSLPQGMHVQYYSATTDANGCTRSVQYSSDGSQTKPQVIQASSGACDAVASPSSIIPAKGKPAVPSAPPSAPGLKV